MGFRLYMNHLKEQFNAMDLSSKKQRKNTSNFARLCNYLSIAWFIVLDLYLGEGRAKRQIKRWWKDLGNNFFPYIREQVNTKQLVVYRNMEGFFVKLCNFCWLPNIYKVHWWLSPWQFWMSSIGELWKHSITT